MLNDSKHPPPPGRIFHQIYDCFLHLTLNLIESPFDAFANRADPDQAALVRAA